MEVREQTGSLEGETTLQVSGRHLQLGGIMGLVTSLLGELDCPYAGHFLRNRTILGQCKMLPNGPQAGSNGVGEKKKKKSDPA